MKESRPNFISVDKERLATFIDAIFAIVMTIMILEVKVPEIGEVSGGNLRHELHKTIVPFTGFLISFFTVAIIWFDHHDLFKLINAATKGFALLNFVFVAIIAILPFSSALAWQYAGDSTATFIYAVNILLISLVIGALFYYVNYFKLINREEAGKSRFYAMKRKLNVLFTGLMILALPLTYVSSYVPLIVAGLTPLTHSLLILFSSRFKS